MKRVSVLAMMTAAWLAVAQVTWASPGLGEPQAEHTGGMIPPGRGPGKP